MNSLDDQFSKNCVRGNFNLIEDLIRQNPTYEFNWNRGLLIITRYTSQVSYPLLYIFLKKGASNIHCIEDRHIPILLNWGISSTLFGDRSQPSILHRTKKQKKISELLQCILIKDVVNLVLSYVAYDSYFRTFHGEFIFY